MTDTQTEISDPGAGTAGGPAGPGGTGKLLAPLRERSFALYFGGQLLSRIGDGIYVVALPFLVLGQGGGSTQLGIALACYGIARLGGNPIGGSLADRLGSRTVMLVADAARVLAVLGFAGLSLLHHIPLWTLIAVAVPFGLLDGVFLPASFSVLPQILPARSLAAGNSLNSTMSSTAQIAGPALGGIVVGSVRSGAAFLIDSVTFLVSTLTLLAIRPRGPAAVDAAGGSGPGPGPAEVPGNWRSVLRYLLGSALPRMSLLITLVVNLTYFGMMEVALPSFARHQLGSGARGFGVIMAGFGAGSVIGALGGNLFLRLPRRGLFALVLGVAEGLAVLCVPVGSSLAVATAAMLVTAAIQGLLNVFYLTMLQREVPPAILGRMMSLLFICAGATFPLSALAAGALSGIGSPTVVIVATGCSISAAFSLGFLSRPYRNL